MITAEEARDITDRSKQVQENFKDIESKIHEIAQLGGTEIVANVPNKDSQKYLIKHLRNWGYYVIPTTDGLKISWVQPYETLEAMSVDPAINSFIENKHTQ